MRQILFLCCSLLFLFSCGGKNETTYPTIESITHSVYATGVIKSKGQYEVYAKVPGIIEEIKIQEGQMIKKDQPLIRLSDASQKLNYENAQIFANYSSLKSNTEKIHQAQNELDVAQLKMENELSLLERQKKLWAQEIGTKNELDQRELNYKNAATNFTLNKLRLDDLKKQLDFQTKQSEKNVAISSVNMNDYTIKSQVNGKVFKINKKLGELATTQSALAVIGSAEDYYIELQVDEYDINKIKLGQKVVLNMDSHKGFVFEAIVEKIYPIMNEQSKSFKLDAVFTKLPEHLFPNLSAVANIVIEVKPNAITIPRAYLIEDTYVLLANKEKRKVTTGLKDYEKVEVLNGITTKDQLVKP